MKIHDHQLQVPGLRMTKQRTEVYRTLMENQDHPSASQIFEQMQDTKAPMSLATVYNCLEALVEHGVVKQVNVDREPTRYCQNSSPHGHFHDQSTGTIHDINFKQGVTLNDFLDLPPGTEVSNLEITIKGTIPKQ
ncbi:MAG: Fur family transcriptional regulator [Rubritalea sp.]|jgi:Fe2+ or Zn2+ uptake regulation protein|tara:strand:+ start:78 stop:482 length:405 start_codon:yes stop_codon:yes gene_type:complete